jgi:hypothetical protein
MAKRLFDPEMFDPAMFDTAESSNPPSEPLGTQGVWATTDPMPKEILETFADYLEVKVAQKVDAGALKS